MNWFISRSPLNDFTTITSDCEILTSNIYEYISDAHTKPLLGNSVYCSLRITTIITWLKEYVEHKAQRWNISRILHADLSVNPDQRAKEIMEGWRLNRDAPHCIAKPFVCLSDKEFWNVTGAWGSRVLTWRGTCPYRWFFVVPVFGVLFLLFVSGRIQTWLKVQLVCFAVSTLSSSSALLSATFKPVEYYPSRFSSQVD